MTLIKTFQQLSKKDVSIAGGKGSSLGEMIKIGIPVPNGFVILTSAFDKFLEENDLGRKIEVELRKINLKNLNSIYQTSNKIQSLILNSEFPKYMAKEILKSFLNLNAKYVAVRSSATVEDSSSASWAGLLESYLNTTKSNLLENVKRCWASLFTPRAIFYCFKNKLKGTKVSVAVVIQKMVKSEISGICFTAHPITKDHDQMIIEACYGLGEAIVSGKITPDIYTIDKRKWKILDKNISNQEVMIVRGKDGNIEKEVSKLKKGKQKLSDFQIFKLAKICQKIEHHYKKPQDIEWAFEKGKFYKGKFYILQSRPMTTL